MPRLSRRPRTTSASPWSRQRRTSVKVGAGDGGAGDRGNGMTLARRDMALMLTHGSSSPTRGWDARRRPSYNSALVTSRRGLPDPRRDDIDKFEYLERASRGSASCPARPMSGPLLRGPVRAGASARRLQREGVAPRPLACSPPDEELAAGRRPRPLEGGAFAARLGVAARAPSVASVARSRDSVAAPAAPRDVLPAGWRGSSRNATVRHGT